MFKLMKPGRRGGESDGDLSNDPVVSPGGGGMSMK